MWILLSIILAILGGLALWLWPSGGEEESTFATVYKTGDPATIALIKSLFEDAGIPLLIKGERAQNLFGVGTLGTGYNVITGPVQIQVPSGREKEANDLLSEIKEIPPTL